MKLQMTLIQSPKGIEVSESAQVIQAHELQLGRGKDNDWVLEDPQRILSAKHCRIFTEGNAGYILDLSTNGTFVNDSNDAIGKGNIATIQHGDRIKAGSYSFKVTICENADEQIAPRLPPTDDDQTDLALNFSPTEIDLLGEEFDDWANLQGEDQQPFAECTAPTPESLNALLDEQPFLDECFVLPLARESATDSADGQRRAQPPGRSQSSHEPLVSATDARSRNQDGSFRSITPALQADGSRQVPLLTEALASEETGLLTALGLSNNRWTHNELSDFKTKLALMARECLQGLMRINRVRDDLKNKLKVSVTTIRSEGNDPIKFAASLEELVESLFIRPTDAYLDPVAAVRGNMKAISQHETAMVAGFHAVIQTLVAELNPESIEIEAEQRKGLFFFRTRLYRTAWWEYKKRYQKKFANYALESALSNSGVFAEAYESKIRSLNEPFSYKNPMESL